MSKTIKTQGGTIKIVKASQESPYRLCRKFFKRNPHKMVMEEFGNIVRKYYPNYGEKEISNLYAELSKSGCTYATMANVLMEQLGNNNDIFQEYFGYSLCNSDGSINYNKLMIDIYACISEMVELTIHRYERRKFSSREDAFNSLLNGTYDNEIQAFNELNKQGWIADGIDEFGMLVFVNKRVVATETFMGKYNDIAKELFGIDMPDISKEQLESLLKKAGLNYQFNYIPVASKFSGLEFQRINNIKKWMNKYFEANNIDLSLETFNVERKDMSFEEVKELILSLLNDKYSIDVCPSVNSNVFMNNGGIFGWGDIHNHAMNFEGFNLNGDILVCSWGKQHIIPKEYYNQLDFSAIKVIKTGTKKKGI